jgi:rod shape-determining protein MreC
MTGSTPTRVNAALLAVLLFGQLFLMAGSVRRLDQALGAERAVQRATGPFVGAASALGTALSDAFGLFGEVRRSRRETARIRRDVDALRAQVERGREHSAENERLRRLLSMREELVPRSVGASVVAVRVSDQARLLVIGAGTADGVRVDLPAVAWGGVVGRVVAVDGAYAKVRLVTDPWSRVAGLVQRSRVEGIVVGRGDGPLEMAYVPKYADVAVGDRVIASGLDGVFPRGFGIGRIVEVGEPVGVSKTIRIAPEVDLGALEEVLVVLKPAPSGLLDPDSARGGS